jgi:alkylation response protein AidB-like acyl-CoA dehydrogenase
MTYRAPLDDILFNILAVAPGPVSPEIPAETREEWRTILEQAAVLVEETIAPLNRASDMSGSVFENGVVRTPRGWREAYATWAEAGWNGVSLPPSHGGAGLPIPIGTATMEMLTSACMALSTLPVLAQCAVPALAAHAESALVDLYLPKLVSGEWTATMNLTEPQAGSDLGLLTSRAEPAGDGTYRLFGQKTFITFGEHDLAENIIHLVLARLPGAPPGTRGLSLFVVPKFLVHPDGRLGPRNDLRCAGVEHKLGIKASPTAVLQFGDHGGAVATLVGQENRGLEYMFIMMNAARFAVGMEGVAVCERAYQQALAYAKERVQSRELGGSGSKPAPIIRHPDVRRMLMSMKAQAEATRALAYVVASAIDYAHFHPDRDERARHQAFVDLMIPVVKGWSTEVSIEVASTGIQVHGGMGFIEETGAAQYLRDARITTIYEGTTGIQANDLIGRKVAREGGTTAKAVLAQIDATVAALRASGSAELGVIGTRLAAGRKAAAECVDWIVATAGTDPKAVHAGAVPFLKLCGVVFGGWQMARAALAAQAAKGEGDAAFLKAKIGTARFFADHHLSQAPALRDVVLEGSAGVLALTEEQF